MEERLKKLMECLPEGMDGALLLAPVHRRYYLDIVSSAGTPSGDQKQMHFYSGFPLYCDGKRSYTRSGGSAAG